MYISRPSLTIRCAYTDLLSFPIADFGVAAQLSHQKSKRNTFVGTPVRTRSRSDYGDLQDATTNTYIFNVTDYSSGWLLR